MRECFGWCWGSFFEDGIFVLKFGGWEGGIYVWIGGKSIFSRRKGNEVIRMGLNLYVGN